MGWGGVGCMRLRVRAGPLKHSQDKPWTCVRRGDEGVRMWGGVRDRESEGNRGILPFLPRLLKPCRGGMRWSEVGSLATSCMTRLELGWSWVGG